MVLEFIALGQLALDGLHVGIARRADARVVERTLRILERAMLLEVGFKRLP